MSWLETPLVLSTPRRGAYHLAFPSRKLVAKQYPKQQQIAEPISSKKEQKTATQTQQQRQQKNSSESALKQQQTH